MRKHAVLIVKFAVLVYIVVSGITCINWTRHEMEQALDDCPETGLAFYFWHRQAEPGEMLKRADLSKTSVSYSRVGFFSLREPSVRAVFSGDGQARLRIGDAPAVSKRITSARYRELLTCMSTNRFSQIRVKRRWGAYMCDFGICQIVLRDGGKRTVMYVDGKHYVDRPEALGAVLAMIHSFDAEFGQPLDNGPSGLANVPDLRDSLAAVTLILAILCGGVIAWAVRRERRNKAKDCPTAAMEVASQDNQPSDKSEPIATVTARHLNVPARVSFVLGLCGVLSHPVMFVCGNATTRHSPFVYILMDIIFFLPVLLGLVAIVFGIKGRGLVFRDPGRRGARLSMAGMIMGFVTLAWVLFVLLTLLCPNPRMH